PRAAARALRAGHAVGRGRPGRRSRRLRGAPAAPLEAGRGAFSAARRGGSVVARPPRGDLGRRRETVRAPAARRRARGVAGAAPDPGRAGAAAPGPARRQRPRRAAGTLARDRPEAPGGRARVRSRADHPLVRARALAARRPPLARPAQLRPRPRPRARAGLGGRPDAGLGLRLQLPRDAHRHRPLADRRLMLRAVLFDVDFTIAKPGPELGPEGYRRLGERFGLKLDPARYPEARSKAIEGIRRHPELEHDEEIWVAFTERIIRNMGGDADSAYDCAV